jgi:hypothetical protein
MNDIHPNLVENAVPSHHEDSTAKMVLLQRHQAYLAKIDRITMLNRSLCLLGLISGGLLLALLNMDSASLCYIGVLLFGLLWRVELSLATYRLKKLEEALARAGGGEWEDRYIRAKAEVDGDEFHRFLLWMEPIAWMAIACFLIGGLIAHVASKKKAEKDQETAVMKIPAAKQGSQGERQVSLAGSMHASVLLAVSLPMGPCKNRLNITHLAGEMV